MGIRTQLESREIFQWSGNGFIVSNGPHRLCGIVFMKTFEFPIDPIIDAFRSLLGRFVLVLMAVAFGYGIGTAIAAKSLSFLGPGIVLFHATAFSSILVSYGALVLLFVFAFAVLYVIFEWSEWSLLFPLLICIWVGWDTTDYAINRSPIGRMERQINESLRNSSEKNSK